MNDEFVDAVRIKLDADLAGLQADSGVAFGLALWDEFNRRGLFTLEHFGWLGTKAGTITLPAYGRRHYAFPSFELAENTYRIGAITRQL